MEVARKDWHTQADGMKLLYFIIESIMERHEPMYIFILGYHLWKEISLEYS